MHVWSACDVKSAINSDNPAGCSAQKLKALLHEVKIKLSGSVVPQRRVDVVNLLCNLDKLTISNPPDYAGVWIASGNVFSVDCARNFSVIATAFSIAQAIIELLGKIAVVLTVSSIDNSTGRAFKETVSYPDLIEYFELLSRKYSGLRDRYNRRTPLKHLANKSVTSVPEVICRGISFVEGRLSFQWDGVAAKFRQKDAIATALSEKISQSCASKWWCRLLAARPLSAESHQLFTHCAKLCRSRAAGEKTELLLDISDDWGPQVFAALSFNSDGRNVAVGVGCGMGSFAAISAAVLELRQNEVALHKVLRKVQHHGEHELTSSELVVYEHVRNFNILNSGLLVVDRPARRETFYTEHTFVRNVAKEAEANGLDMFYADVSGPGGILSVVKVISPQLQGSVATGMATVQFH